MLQLRRSKHVPQAGLKMEVIVWTGIWLLDEATSVENICWRVQAQVVIPSSRGTANISSMSFCLSPYVQMKTSGYSVPLTMVGVRNISKHSSRREVFGAHLNQCCNCAAAGSIVQSLRDDSSSHHPTRHHGGPQRCFSDEDGARDPARAHPSRTHPQTRGHRWLCGVSTKDLWIYPTRLCHISVFFLYVLHLSVSKAAGLTVR